MALTAPWRDCTCGAAGEGPGDEPGAVGLPGPAPLIDLSG